jgi:hypothetical protein
MSSCWLTSNNAPILYMSQLGNVGINTISPQYNLDVSGNANISSNLQVGSFSNSGSTSLSGPILMNDIVNAKWQLNTIGYKLNFNNDTGPSNAFTNKMVLTNAGQLGLGTTSPSEALHVIGNAKMSGNIMSESGHYGSVGATVLESGSSQFNFRKIVGSNSASYTDLAVMTDSNMAVYGALTAASININSIAGIDLGYSIAGRDVASGRIGYGLYTPNTLDIVGAGASANTRQIKLWDNVLVNQNLTVSGSINNVGFTNVSNLATAANTLSISTSNYVYPQIATLNSSIGNNNLVKGIKSTNSTGSINTTVKWANNTQSLGNHHYLILDVNQHFSNDSSFGIRNTQLCISMSNCSIADQRSANVWGAPPVFTTMSCVVSASNPATQTLTLTSSTSWTPTGSVCHQFVVSLLSAPNESGTVTIS